MYIAGVDVGGMSIKCCIANEKGEILAKNSFRTKDGITSAEMAQGIATCIKDIANSANIQMSEIKALGMGAPGTVDPKKGMIVYSNNIKLEHAPIVQDVKKYFDCPVFVGNDANAAALGEMLFGSGKGMENLVFITLGTGVGTGIVIDGKLLTGKGGSGAEGGHSCLKINGERCTCGNRGCWEIYASATGLVKQTAKAIEKNPDSMMAEIVKKDGKVSGRTAFIAARAGDKAGLRVVQNYVKYVASGIIGMVNIFRPDAVLIGGGVSNEGDYFISRVSRYVNRFCYGAKINGKVKVKAAALLNDAGLLGGVALALAGLGE